MLIMLIMSSMSIMFVILTMLIMSSPLPGRFELPFLEHRLRLPQ